MQLCLYNYIFFAPLSGIRARVCPEEKYFRNGSRDKSAVDFALEKLLGEIIILCRSLLIFNVWGT